MRPNSRSTSATTLSIAPRSVTSSWMALAAAPINGGHYHFVRVLGHDRPTSTTLKVEVELTLANDGRELAYPSGVSEQIACGPGDTITDGLAFDGA